MTLKLSSTTTSLKTTLTQSSSLKWTPLILYTTHTTPTFQTSDINEFYQSTPVDEKQTLQYFSPLLKLCHEPPINLYKDQPVLGDEESEPLSAVNHARRRSQRDNQGKPAKRLIEAMMTVVEDYNECDEDWAPNLDPIKCAYTIIDSENLNDCKEEIDKYLPEPQNFQGVLACEPQVRSAWLHAIFLEIQNLIDNDTFLLGHIPEPGELIILARLVMKAKETINGALEKLKAHIIARGDMEKRRMKTHTKARNKAIETMKSTIAEARESGTPRPTLLEIPKPLENTWSPCASSRGVKMFIAVVCAKRRKVKMGDFIGTYLQAKVIGKHFMKLPAEFATYFPQYAKYFGVPLLLNKGVYALVNSGKRWNEEISEWLYSQGFIQLTADPSYFCKTFKHGAWIRLIFFIDDMIYASSNDQLEHNFEESVKSRFNVQFMVDAQWFLQMCIHRYSDGRYLLDQHHFALKTTNKYDP